MSNPLLTLINEIPTEVLCPIVGRVQKCWVHFFIFIFRWKREVLPALAQVKEQQQLAQKRTKQSQKDSLYFSVECVKSHIEEHYWFISGWLMEMHLIHILWHFKGLQKISLTVRRKHILSNSCAFFFVPLFSLSLCIFPPLSPSSSDLSVPLFIPFPFFSLFNPSLAPLSTLFYLSSLSFFTQSSIYFSVLEHYRAVRVNGVPVSSTGQVINLCPSRARWHGALLSPSSVGAGQSGMRSVGAGPG